jgi:molecular chaperone HscC
MRFLGGEDFTDRIVTYFAKTLGLNLSDIEASELSRLRAVADHAKHLLSDEPRVSLAYRHAEEERILSLSRDTFEDLTADLVNRMKVPLQRAIGDAGLSASQIDRIVMVGGATRMLSVRNLITRLFKRFPEYALDPDTVVALGAAMQAGLVSRDVALDDVVMTDVCPFTLGFETSRKTGADGHFENGLFMPLIERNTTIPASRNQMVETVQLGQTQLHLNIYQGEAPYVRDNIRIGSYKITLPYNTADYEKVDVRFTYDSSGVLEVIATTLATKETKTLIIENAPGAMSAEAIAKRFKELERIKIHPREDAVKEALISHVTAAYGNALGRQRIEIGMLLGEFEEALRTYDKRLIAHTRSRIEGMLKSIEGSSVFD